MASTDDFNRSDTGPPASSSWTDDSGNSFSKTNHGSFAKSGGGYSFAHKNNDTPAGAHWASVKYLAYGGLGECGPWVRATASGPSGYVGFARTDLARIYRVDSGAFTLISSELGSFAANTVVRLEASGENPTTLTLLKDGASLGTATDSNYDLDKTVYGMFSVSGDGTSINASIETLDDWAGGDLGGGGGGTVGTSAVFKLVAGF